MKAEIIDIITKDGKIHHIENVIDNYIKDSFYVIKRLSAFKDTKCISVYALDFIQTVEIYNYAIE